MQLELDRVVFVPVGEAPHRELQDDPGPESRLEMVELAIGDDDRFTSSRIEIDREGPSYTVDTLEELRKESPKDELFLILGGDQAAALPTWHEPEKVLERASVAVFERMSWGRNAIKIKIGRMPGVERVLYLDMPLIQVSSSAIRRRVRESQPIRYLVQDKVADYISSNDLYGAGRTRRGRDLVSTAAPTPDSTALAERIAEIASDKKAIDIRVIDLRGIVSYTDFFVICSGNTERQAKAIHDGIYEELKKGSSDRLLPRRTEGAREARWILLDYWDVVVHIFTPEAREYYRLENLWGEAPARSVG